MLKQQYREVLPDGAPGFITFVQTFGDLVTFNPHIGMIVYRSRIHQRLKRNYKIMPGAQCPALLLQPAPDQGEYLVWYYGWYNIRRRDMRRHSAENNREVIVHEAPLDPDFRYTARAAGARLIQKVSALAPASLYLASLQSYAVDPLSCPHRGGGMRRMARIDDPPVIE